MVSSVEADPPLCQGRKGIVVSHVGIEDKEATVETVRPANIRDCGEFGVEVEQLVGSSESDHISIQVHYPLELCLPPELDLCECGDQVGSTHEIEVRRLGIGVLLDRYDIVVDGLERLAVVPVVHGVHDGDGDGDGPGVLLWCPKTACRPR